MFEFGQHNVPYKFEFIHLLQCKNSLAATTLAVSHCLTLSFLPVQSLRVSEFEDTGLVTHPLMNLFGNLTKAGDLYHVQFQGFKISLKPSS